MKIYIVYDSFEFDSIYSIFFSEKLAKECCEEIYGFMKEENTDDEPCVM